MLSQANDFLRRLLINPLSFYLSTSSKSRESCPAFSVASALKSPKQVLIIPDSRAGGLFLGAPQFWAIRHRYPQAQISLLVHSHKEYIAREIPFVDSYVVYEDFLLPLGTKLREAIRHLKNRNFDIAFCFSSEDNFCPAYLCFKSEARIRIGFQRSDFPFFNIRIIPRKESCYELQRFSPLLRTLGIPQVKERVSWSISEEGAQKIQDRFLVGRNPEELFVGIDVSSTKGERLSLKQLQTVSKDIVARPNTRALIFFDNAEKKVANHLKETLAQKALLCQTDNLPKVVALLETCHRLIANNTDLFHLAVAMGLPVTGIFEAIDIQKWLPVSKDQLNIYEYETIKSWTPEKLSLSIQKKLDSD